MGEKELLEKEKKKANILVFLIFMFLVISPLFVILTLKPEYYFLNTPSLIFVGALSLIMLVFYVWTDSHPILNVWFSLDEIIDMEAKAVGYIFVFAFIGIFQSQILLYFLFDYNMFDSEMWPAYLFTIIIVASGYPLMAYARKISMRRFGKSRAVRVAIKKKHAEKIVKKALDSLGLIYEEFPGNVWKSKIWTLKLNNGAEIRMIPQGKISLISINNISDDWIEKEGEIERVILEKLI
jgi:hypothetical protein